MTNREQSWVILRTSGMNTLRLAESLGEVGYDVWAPSETVKKVRGGKIEDVQVPLISQLVFVRADRLQDILALSHSPSLQYQIWDAEKGRMVTRGHPYFQLFKPFGDIRFVPDRQLAALRLIERRRKPRGVIKPIAVGTKVNLTQGGFEGLTGTVEEVRGKFASVAIQGFPASIQIACWLLREALDSAEQSGLNRLEEKRKLRYRNAA